MHQKQNGQQNGATTHRPTHHVTRNNAGLSNGQPWHGMQYHRVAMPFGGKIDSCLVADHVDEHQHNLLFASFSCTECTCPALYLLFEEADGLQYVLQASLHLPHSPLIQSYFQAVDLQVPSGWVSTRTWNIVPQGMPSSHYQWCSVIVNQGGNEPRRLLQEESQAHSGVRGVGCGIVSIAVVKPPGPYHWHQRWRNTWCSSICFVKYRVGRQQCKMKNTKTKQQTK